MKKRKFLYFFTILLVRFFFKLLYRHQVYGIENYPKGGGIIASNHVSFLDPPCIAISCPEEIHFLAKESLFKSPFGKFLLAVHAHPIQKNAGNLRLIKQMCLLAAKGNKVLIFPEGTRSKDNTLLPIQSGIGLILSKSQSLIVPTYVHGTFGVWKLGKKFPKLWGKTAVVFGKPICWQEYAEMSQKEAKERIPIHLTQALKQLRKWYEGGRKGSPP